MAKDYFTQHNVEYKDINVEQDDAAAADMIKKSGQMGVPVIDIDGTIIVGFDRGSIDEILHQLPGSLEPLLLLSVINSQNIPIELIEKFCTEYLPKVKSKIRPPWSD